MRRLLLLRHAKTERANLSGDHARRLIERGLDDAERMGAFLQREQLLPERALVSSAARTRETFSALSAHIGASIPVNFAEALYLASPDAILELVRATPDDGGALLVIGHNPGIHQLALALGQRGPGKLVAALAIKFPTCALAVIESDVDAWRDIDAANCRLARYMTAKALRLHEVGDFDDD